MKDETIELSATHKAEAIRLVAYDPGTADAGDEDLTALYDRLDPTEASLLFRTAAALSEAELRGTVQRLASPTTSVIDPNPAAFAAWHSDLHNARVALQPYKDSPPAGLTRTDVRAALSAINYMLRKLNR